MLIILIKNLIGSHKKFFCKIKEANWATKNDIADIYTNFDNKIKELHQIKMN